MKDKRLQTAKKVLRTTLSLLLVLGVLLSAGSGVVLFLIKHEVMRLERTLKVIQRSFIRVEQDITLLTSEWTYLTRPERIEKIVKHHLKTLMPLYGAQIVKKVNS